MNSKEIAKIAGVSRATVSRVVNNVPNVQPETRERVLEVIKKYNYVPIESGRNLAGKPNRFIGVFVIDINMGSSESRVSKSPYFSELLSSVIDISSKFRYNAAVSIVTNAKQYSDVKNIFLNKTISGGIFIGAKNSDIHIKELLQLQYKVALIDQEPNDNDYSSKCIIANFDNFKGAYDATKYLIDLGHREIGHIAGDMSKFSGKCRYDGFKKALEDANIVVDNSLIVKGDFTENAGYKAAKKIFHKRRPTALFSGNDTMALGAIRALSEIGLNVPDDVSIIGFDDIDISRYITPKLSSVKVSLYHLASISVENLIKSIESNLQFNATYTIPVEVVKRESCKKLGDNKA